MELVYLWVEGYKNIRRQGFNFSPRFECTFHDKYNDNGTLKDDCLLDIKPKEHIENFFGKKINVTAIVGENGSGKSHILNLLREYTINNCFFILLKKNELVVYNLFVSQTSIKPVNKTSYIMKDFIILNNFDFTTPAFQYTQSEKLFNPLQYLYFKTYIDFNNIPDNEFGIENGRNNFLDRIYRFDYLQKLFESKKKLQNTIAIREKLQLESRDIDIKTILDNIKFDFHRTFSKYYFKFQPFLNVYFHDISFSLNFRSIEEIYRYSPYKDKIVEDTFCKTLFEEYSKNIYVEEKLFGFDKESKLDYKKLTVLISLLSLYVRHDAIQSFVNSTPVNSLPDLFLKIMDKKNNFSEHIQEEIKIWNDLYNLFQISAIDTKKFFEINFQLYNLIKHDIFNLNFQPSLSTGQERLIYILIELYDFFTLHLNKNDSIVVLDEGESFLHPTWQKQFISILVNFFETFFPDINIHLILTSHSPFLLSDLPKENVIFLERYKEEDHEVQNRNQKIDNCKNVTKETNIDTFGANIHTLLSHGFFMKDGLMGEFAKGKINQVYNFITQQDTSFIKTKEEAQNIINLIGEPLIKKQLQKLFDETFDKSNLTLDDEIELLEKKLNALKELKK